MSDHSYGSYDELTTIATISNSVPRTPQRTNVHHHGAAKADDDDETAEALPPPPPPPPPPPSSPQQGLRHVRSVGDYDAALLSHSQSARKSLRRRFSVEKPTEDLFHDFEDCKFYGAYGHIRAKLDYKYHAHYKKARQWLHDSIIEDALERAASTTSSSAHHHHHHHHSNPNNNSSPNGNTSRTKNRSNNNNNDTTNLVGTPWLILTVGAQGAGKSHTLQQLLHEDRIAFFLGSYLFVDTDEIRRLLPEYSSYVENCPDRVNELTGKEAGYIAETMVRAALLQSSGRTVVWDCALRDAAYFCKLLQELKSEWGGCEDDTNNDNDNSSSCLKVGMIHVTASLETVLERAKRKSVETGHEIPTEQLLETMESLPTKIEMVKPFVDEYFVIMNNGHTSNGDDVQLLLHEQPQQQQPREEGSSITTTPTASTDWSDFRKAFCNKILLELPKTVIANHNDTSTNNNNKPSLFSLSKQRNKHRRRFSVLRSTEENHKASHMHFYGRFSHIRKTLDYSYHCNYTFKRQILQDAIVNHFLQATVVQDSNNGELCTTPTEPWIVFTAGAMGAGKTHTMKRLVANGRFPLLAFVNVDPDAIRQNLPEFHIYVEQSPELAGELTRKEAGFVAEILTLAGLQTGKNVLVDGSLRDWQWYKCYFARLRQEFPSLRIAILHVTAPREAVFQRAAERAMETGRIVPPQLLQAALEQVPKSVEILSPLVDYCAELNNPAATADADDDIELVTPGETWESFESQWRQTCAWVPSQRVLEKLTQVSSSNSLRSLGNPPSTSAKSPGTSVSSSSNGVSSSNHSDFWNDLPWRDI